jgi:hypothetical protein
MSLTSRRARSLDPSTPHLRDTRLVVIATEGIVRSRSISKYSGAGAGASISKSSQPLMADHLQCMFWSA